MSNQLVIDQKPKSFKGTPKFPRGTQEEFLARVQKIHPQYNFSKFVYSTSKAKSIVICKEHGEFSASASSLYSGRGCPKCGTSKTIQKRSKVLTQEEFLEKMKKIHGDKYDFSKAIYKRATEKVCVICPKHGEFWIQPSNLHIGCGCTSCQSSKFENATENILKREEIEFETQKTFPGLKDKKNLRVDFYLPLYNLVIECQGQQHYNSHGSIGKYKITKDKLKDTQYKDQLKRTYFKQNNIKLLEIPYTEFKKKTYESFLIESIEKFSFMHTTPSKENIMPRRKIMTKNELFEKVQTILDTKEFEYTTVFNPCLYKDYTIHYSFEKDSAIRDLFAQYCWDTRGEFPYNVKKTWMKHHPSFFDANVAKQLSPKDAWDTEILFKKCVINRTIHNNALKPIPLRERIPNANQILSGFNVSKIAPYVSNFPPKKAKELIEQFVPTNVKTIVDPFSGFSGRLVGSLEAGKNYIGFDLNEIHIEESKNVAKEYSKKGLNVTLEAKDLFKTEKRLYEECWLLTCSPYGGPNGNKESWNHKDEVNLSCDEWIDEVLKRYECEGYIFVVDQTTKYIQFLKEYQFAGTRGNTSSFFGAGKAYIIIIKKEDLASLNI